MRLLIRSIILPFATPVVLAGPARSQSSPHSADMFRGGAAHFGVSLPAGAHLLGVEWRLATEGPVFSSPVVHNGTAYLGSGESGDVYLSSPPLGAAWLVA